MENNNNLLSVRNLCVDFILRNKLFQQKQILHAVENVSFDITKNEIIGIIGESGSGKSTIGKTIVGINQPSSGIIKFENENIFEKNHQFKSKLRKDIQIIFQNYSNALNPRMSVNNILLEPLQIHKKDLSHDEHKKIVKHYIDKICLPQSILTKYPHEISGGQRQRIAIARSISIQPKLLICDEIASALDPILQKDIIEMIKNIQSEQSLSIIFITHDIALAKDLCHKTLVMYNGSIIENSLTNEIIHFPKNNYTKKLLASVLKVY